MEKFDAVRSAMPVCINDDLAATAGRYAWHGAGPLPPPHQELDCFGSGAGFPLFNARHLAPALFLFVPKHIDWKNGEAHLGECQCQPHDNLTQLCSGAEAPRTNPRPVPNVLQLPRNLRSQSGPGRPTVPGWPYTPERLVSSNPKRGAYRCGVRCGMPSSTSSVIDE